MFSGSISAAVHWNLSHWGQDALGPFSGHSLTAHGPVASSFFDALGLTLLGIPGRVYTRCHGAQSPERHVPAPLHQARDVTMLIPTSLQFLLSWRFGRRVYALGTRRVPPLSSPNSNLLTAVRDIVDQQDMYTRQTLLCSALSTVQTKHHSLQTIGKNQSLVCLFFIMITWANVTQYLWICIFALLP